MTEIAMDWSGDFKEASGSSYAAKQLSSFAGDDVGMYLEDPVSWYAFSEALVSA